MQNPDDYPGNEDIRQQRQAVLDLERSEDWQALEMAKKDLYSMVKAKEKWCNE